jgi:hypothetical protein
MDSLVSRLRSMSYGDAHNHLMALDLPVDLRVSLAAKANELRMHDAKEGKNAKLMHIHRAEMWHRLIAPLKYTLSNARVGLRLKPQATAPERHLAFSEYITLLEKLLLGLQTLRTLPDNGERRPVDIAQERGLPNKGVHWTDWVADRTRRRIEGLFYAIPFALKTKRFEPFKRQIPPDMFKRDVSLLQRRTFKELDILRQEIKIMRKIDCMTNEQRASLDKMEQQEENIVAAIEFMSRELVNEVVPWSWHAINPNPNTLPLDEEDEAALRLQLQTARKPAKKTRRPKRYNV